MRLLTFRPGAPGEVTDQFLRQHLLPGLVERPGLQHAYAGRIIGEVGSRAVLSVWAGVEPDDLGKPFDPERDRAVADSNLEVLPTSLVLSLESPADARILRIFRGRARQGRAADYVGAVRDGTVADAEGGRGPSALFLGMLDDDRFVTASTWLGWERIQAATGGDIRQPVATRHRELLLEGMAEHYEIVPNAVVLPAEPGQPARLAGDPAARS
ncbi:MAG TPA: hypothetical protein VM305_11170 [Candidatus Limnocylindrales bacterium]|nr:hypothetical protein [Candidatus Limnocylindrales bacterium]